MFLKNNFFKLRQLLAHFWQLWIPPAPTKEALLLQEAALARQEWLCLFSWFNEISHRDTRFTELTHRLLAAEIRYRLCLDKLRLEGIGKETLPYTAFAPRRGITRNGCWYGW